jgi:hypothetical protein
MIRQKTLLGAKLAKKEGKYADYAGGALQTSETMADIDLILENKLVPTSLVPFIKLYRAYLDGHRKAFFMTLGSDVLTQLSALVGDQRVVKDVSGSDPRLTT